MNAEDIIEMFKTIIDDDPDDVYTLNLLNLAKDEVESERPWNFLRAVDSSVTASPTDNYLTSHILPLNIAIPRKIYLAGELSPYMLIPFEDRERYKDIYKRYYIDWANSVYYLCGKVGSSLAINFFYSKFTDDLEIDDEPVWPKRFRRYLPYRMAAIHMSGADADDLNIKMSANDELIAKALLKQFIAWDNMIKTIEYNDKQNGSIDYESYPNIVGNY